MNRIDNFALKRRQIYDTFLLRGGPEENLS